MQFLSLYPICDAINMTFRKSCRDFWLTYDVFVSFLSKHYHVVRFHCLHTWIVLKIWYASVSVILFLRKQFIDFLKMFRSSKWKKKQKKKTPGNSRFSVYIPAVDVFVRTVFPTPHFFHCCWYLGHIFMENVGDETLSIDIEIYPNLLCIFL